MDADATGWRQYHKLWYVAIRILFDTPTPSWLSCFQICERKTNLFFVFRSQIWKGKRKRRHIHGPFCMAIRIFSSSFLSSPHFSLTTFSTKVSNSFYVLLLFSILHSFPITPLSPPFPSTFWASAPSATFSSSILSTCHVNIAVTTANYLGLLSGDGHYC